MSRRATYEGTLVVRLLRWDMTLEDAEGQPNLEGWIDRELGLGLGKMDPFDDWRGRIRLTLELLDEEGGKPGPQLEAS